MEFADIANISARAAAMEAQFQFSALRTQAAAGCSLHRRATAIGTRTYICDRTYRDNIPQGGSSLMTNKPALDKFSLSLSSLILISPPRLIRATSTVAFARTLVSSGLFELGWANSQYRSILLIVVTVGVQFPNAVPCTLAFVIISRDMTRHPLCLQWDGMLFQCDAQPVLLTEFINFSIRKREQCKQLSTRFLDFMGINFLIKSTCLICALKII